MIRAGAATARVGVGVGLGLGLALAVAACGTPTQFGFDPSVCLAGASQHRYLDDGSEAFTVIGLQGDVCIVDHMRETHGAKTFEVCRVPKTAKTLDLPRLVPPPPLSADCTARSPANEAETR